MKTDDLISRLEKDLTPVTPPENAAVFAMKWTAVALLVITVIMVLVRPRADLLQNFAEADILWQLLGFVGLLLAALAMTSWYGSPGRPKPRLWLVILIGALLFSGLVPFVRMIDLDSAGMHEGMEVQGFGCSLVAIITGLISGFLFARKIRQGASLKPSLSGILLGLAALGAGGIAITLHCGNHNGMHILLWHWTLPLLVTAGFGFVVGKKFLRW